MTHSKTSNYPRRIGFSLLSCLWLCLPLACGTLDPAAETFAVKVEQTTRRQWVISERSVLLVMPAQGQDLSSRQGFQLQQQLQQALAQVFAEVGLVVETAASVTTATLPDGRAPHYYVVPQLLRRNDRTGSLAELVDLDAPHDLGRDDVAVKLLLYGARGDELLDSTIIQASNRWFSLGRQTPDHLLQQAFRNYAVQLSAPGSAYRQ
ncbi:MAG: DUF4823 domain-containing protein [Gammaproteobacteria bacterium]|nr:DUF4823 domain-containing protein [Gammaproteobacteria bacterium]